MTHLHDVPVGHHLRQALGDLRAGRSQQHHHPGRGLCVDGVEEAIHAYSRITLVVGKAAGKIGKKWRGRRMSDGGQAK